MKKTFLMLFCVFSSCIIKAQITTTSQWTWIKGDSTINKQGVYGTIGVASPLNKPGGRRGSITWQDASGNLWLYGGSGYSTSSTIGSLNDLWKYSPQTNEWTWVQGSNTINVVVNYGSMGIADFANTPGGLMNVANWKDSNGDFWLLGTSSVLWKYSVSTNQWTWMKGDTTTIPSSANLGKYGNQGVPDNNNEPGSRSYSMGWTDNAGNFWLFGGSGAGNSANGYLNDLWKYDPITKTWTWMKGDSTVNQRSLFGTKGLAAASNTPSGRTQSVTWADQSGNLWLFGGFGRAFYPQGGNYNNFYLSDLWKYSISTNQWTWVNGDSTLGFNQFSVYGSQGVPSAANKPGLRGDASGSTDSYGNLWLYHGWGSSSNAATEMLNDLMKYNPSTNEWTWIKGDITGNKTGTYGNLGNAGSLNKPGSRWDLSTWMDGNIWVFGGEGYAGSGGQGYLNDLWKLSNVYTFIGNGDWNTSSNWLNNNVPQNIISGSTTVIINPQSGGDCTYNGNITIQQGGTLTIKSSKLNITGNLSNAGFLNGSGTVNFTGGVATALNSSGVITTPISISNKQIFLTGHTATNSITLSGTSSVRLDNYTLTMGNASLSGYNNQNFIITNGEGKLSRIVNDTAAVVFPIGDNINSYTPLTISNPSSARTAKANSTTSVSGTFNVQVRTGVQFGSPGIPITRGVVNRTWAVSHDLDTSARFRVAAEWTASLEQPDFDRINSLIAQVCPPPDNCVTGFDIIESSAATGSNPYMQSRVGPFPRASTLFIVRSAPVKFEFTGAVNTDWNNSTNWLGGVKAPTTILEGIEVIISSDCSFNGNLTLNGGKLTVKPGKQFNVAN